MLGDRRARGLLRGTRSGVHQHANVASHQPPRREQHQPGDEQRGDRVGLGVAGPYEQEPDQHRDRADEIEREVQRVRAERGARVLVRRTVQRARTARVDQDHSAHDGQHVPARVRRRAVPGETVDRLIRDHEARDDQDHGLAERRQVLGLAVPVGVLAVGGAPRDAHREERQQRRDQVGGGVDRLGDQPEAVREQAHHELDRHQRRRGGDRHQRRALRRGARAMVVVVHRARLVRVPVAPSARSAQQDLCRKRSHPAHATGDGRGLLVDRRSR